MRESCGILIFSKETGRFLLLLREEVPRTWHLLSGGLEKDEIPIDCIKREIIEEINYDSDTIQITKIGEIVHNLDDWKHHLFIGYVEKEFNPILDTSENYDYGWFDFNSLPTPLFSKFMTSFEMIKSTIN